MTLGAVGALGRRVAFPNLFGDVFLKAPPQINLARPPWSPALADKLRRESILPLHFSPCQLFEIIYFTRVDDHIFE